MTLRPNSSLSHLFIDVCSIWKICYKYWKWGYIGVVSVRRVWCDVMKMKIFHLERESIYISSILGQSANYHNIQASRCHHACHHHHAIHTYLSMWLIAWEISVDHYNRSPGIVSLLNCYLLFTVTHIQALHTEGRFKNLTTHSITEPLSWQPVSWRWWK